MKTMHLRRLMAAGAMGAATVLACAAHAAEDDGKPKQSVSEYTADAAITAKVKAAIVKEPSISALQIAVETNQGVVQLSGTVDTAAQSEAATRVTREVEGVTQVKNDLKVKAP